MAPWLAYVPFVPVVLLCAVLFARYVRRRWLKLRNAWTCSKCDQYNGFDQSGGYNRDLPAQRDARYNTGNYCGTDFTKRPQSRTRDRKIDDDRPDLLRFSSKMIDCEEEENEENGLCSECNRNQSIVVKLVGDFQPSKEESFDHELAAYRRRLDDVYGLCGKCLTTVDRKLNADRRNINHLMMNTWTSPLSNKATNQNTSTSRRKKKKRGNAGVTSRAFQLLTIILQLLLCFNSLDHLQRDSGAEVLLVRQIFSQFKVSELLWGNYVDPLLNWASWTVALCSLLTHAAAVKFCLSCLILSDLVAVPCYASLVVVMLLGRTNDSFLKREDVLVWSAGLATIGSLLAVSVAVLPRKRLRKQKTKFSSAFSIASTPMSQLSACDLSSTLSSPPTSIRGRGSVISPARFSPTSTSVRNDGVVSPDMDTTSHLTTRFQAGADRKWRENETPSRELGPKLTSLTLNSGGVSADTERAAVRRGPFSSLSFNHAAAKAASSSRLIGGEEARAATSSVLAPSRLTALSSQHSTMNSIWSPSFGGRPPPFTRDRQFRQPTPPPSVVDSMFESASQHGRLSMQQQSGQPADFVWKVALGVGLAVSLLSNAFVVYYVLTK